MGWADIKRRYERQEGSATQSTEDKAARRILRACGITEPKLALYEKEHGLCLLRRDDTTLLERAVAVATTIVDVFKAPRVLSVKSQREAEDTLLEVAESSRDQQYPAIVYSINGSDNLMAMLFLGCTCMLDTKCLPIPCCIKYSRDGKYLIATCEAIDLYVSLIRKGK